MKPKIGVYVCHCGHNIAGVVDVAEVRDYAARLPKVSVARDLKYTCSDAGQRAIAGDIRKLTLDRVVVASCSPTIHESTFRKLVEANGLNPYFFEMVNIREQCSWVHQDDKAKATEKAKDLVKASVLRSARLEALEKAKSPVNKEVLVIGGGVAGIFSALYLAKTGVRVHLVERKPSIGGHMAQLDKTFPTLDCSQCILSPKMVEVLEEKNINLLTNSEVSEVKGFAGNYSVKVRRKPRYVDLEKCVSCGACALKCPTRMKNEFDNGLSERKAIYLPFPQAIPNAYIIDSDKCLRINKNICGVCEKTCEARAIDFSQKEETIELNVGAIILATGFKPYNPKEKKQYGYGRYRNVVTSMDFERMINADGPTKGKLKRPSDSEVPKSVAFIQCVGSRDDKVAPYCSRICCMITVKQAALIKEKYPETEVYVYYTDIRTAGKNFEEFYKRTRDKGVIYIRGRPGEITESEDKSLNLLSEDMDSGALLENQADMVVLACGLQPPEGLKELSQKLHTRVGGSGFAEEAHPKLRPAESSVDGIYIAGCVQFPKDISDTVAQAGNAVAAALQLLNREFIEVEGITAEVDREKCSGCGECVTVCPYEAIKLDNEGKAQVTEILCKGCGACAAACLADALTQRHYKNAQIMAQINAYASSGK